MCQLKDYMYYSFFTYVVELNVNYILLLENSVYGNLCGVLLRHSCLNPLFNCEVEVIKWVGGGGWDKINLWYVEVRKKW
jgi:hypothetical protein